jgi:hypothetical protein
MLAGDLLTLSFTAGILFALLDHWGTVTDAIVGGAAVVSRAVSGNVHEGPAAIQGVQRILDAAFMLWEHSEIGIGSMLEPITVLCTLLFKLAVALLLLRQRSTAASTSRRSTPELSARARAAPAPPSGEKLGQRRATTGRITASSDADRKAPRISEI